MKPELGQARDMPEKNEALGWLSFKATARGHRAVGIFSEAHAGDRDLSQKRATS